ncbi:MAG: ATP-binding cassette domain-containing protein [Monoglobales bacterium]
MNVIEIEGLTKIYGNKKAVNNISFSVQKGEILGFLGPNGAGKSTTMNMLTGYISADGGSASVCGYNILSQPNEAKQKIGYLPEQPPLYFDMTVTEYLNFVYNLKKVTIDRKSHLIEVMKTVGLTEVKDRLIKNLSKGYKQRVGLAQALVGNPEVLILDEPTVGLDPVQIIEIRNVIKKLGKNRTIILSTHILQEVTAVCDRVVIINRGKIAASDTIQNLSGSSASGRFVLRVKGDEFQAKNILSEIAEIKSAEVLGIREKGSVDIIVEARDGADIREKVFNAFAEKNTPIIMNKPMEKTIEDVFVKVIGDTEAEQETEEMPVKRSLMEKLLRKGE